MKRFAAMLLLGLGTLTAGQAWAGPLDSAQGTSSDAPTTTDPAALPPEESGTTEKPTDDVTVGGTDVPAEGETLEMEPLVNVADEPAEPGLEATSQPVDFNEVKRGDGEATPEGEPQEDPGTTDDTTEVPSEIVELSSPPQGSGEEVIMTTAAPGAVTGGTVQNTPEPSTLLLAGIGATLLGARACRRRRLAETR
jgi:hypothetical protein